MLRGLGESRQDTRIPYELFISWKLKNNNFLTSQEITLNPKTNRQRRDPFQEEFLNYLCE